MAANVIAILNQKGGTGKTTTAINLGCALAETGKRVLLVDFDPQGSLTYSFAIKHGQKSLYDVLLGDTRLADVLVEKEGLWVAPSDNALADAELSLVRCKNREFFLKKRLATVSNEFDYIVIDCSPSLSLLTVNALVCTSEVVIPAPLEVLTMQGISLIASTIQKVKKAFNPNLRILGVLPVMVDTSHKVAEEIYALLPSTGLHIFESHIEFDERVIEAPSFGKSILAYAPQSPAAIQYRHFAEELTALGRLVIQ